MIRKVWDEIQSARIEPDGITKLRQYSYLAWGTERFFFYLRFVSPSILFIETRTLVHSRMLVDPTYSEPSNIRRMAKRRAHQVDFYIVFWIVLEVLLIGVGTYRPDSSFFWGTRVMMIIRILDILQANVNLNVFDRLRFGESHITASLTRNLILAIVTYLELILAFGVLYLTMPQHLVSSIGHMRDLSWDAPLYFSCMTQLTVGYGDIYPIGPARMIAGVQAFLGLIFSLLIMGRFISYMPVMRTAYGDHDTTEEE